MAVRSSNEKAPAIYRGHLNYKCPSFHRWRCWRPIAGSNWIVAVFGGPQRESGQWSVPPKGFRIIYLERGVYINFKKVFRYTEIQSAYCTLYEFSMVSKSRYKMSRTMQLTEWITSNSLHFPFLTCMLFFYSLGMIRV